jgi:hypothetical protein
MMDNRFSPRRVLAAMSFAGYVVAPRVGTPVQGFSASPPTVVICAQGEISQGIFPTTKPTTGIHK